MKASFVGKILHHAIVLLIKKINIHFLGGIGKVEMGVKITNTATTQNPLFHQQGVDRQTAIERGQRVLPKIVSRVAQSHLPAGHVNRRHTETADWQQAICDT